MSTLTIVGVGEGDAGNYTCVASNSEGSEESSRAGLLVACELRRLKCT